MYEDDSSGTCKVDNSNLGTLFCIFLFFNLVLSAGVWMKYSLADALIWIGSTEILTCICFEAFERKLKKNVK